MPARWLLGLCCLLVPAWDALADPTPTPPPAPASLAVPVNQTLALTLTASGYQIYEWRAVPGQTGKYEWVFKEPEADLFDAQGRKVGHHSAGPTWELTDGGEVVGRVRVKTDAPDGNGVPWLLLDAVQASGGGVMARIKSIRRINTSGGQASSVPPAPGPPEKMVGCMEKVGYTATYEFYVAKP